MKISVIFLQIYLLSVACSPNLDYSMNAFVGVLTESNSQDLPEVTTISDVPEYNKGIFTVEFNGSSDKSLLNYEAKLCTDASCLSCGDTITVDPGAEQSFTDLSDGETYYLCVRTTNDGENFSEWLASSATVTDTQAPSAFAILTPADSATTNASPTISWSASSDQSPLTYNLSIATVSGCASGVVQNYTISSGSTSQQLTTLGGNTFYICLEARDAAGNVTSTVERSFIADASVPVFTSIDLANDALSNGTINKEEHDFTNDLVTNLVATDTVNGGYKVISNSVDCNASTGAFSTVIPKSNDANFTSSGLYRVCVRLEDDVGNFSYGVSSDITFDETDPNPPSGVSISGSSVTSLSLNYTSGTDGYAGVTHNVKACTDIGCSSSCVGNNSGAKPTTISGLNLGYIYYACVQTEDAAGNTSDYINSNNTVTTPQAAPNEITDLTATANSSSSITLSWISGGGSTTGFYVAYASGATAPSDCTNSHTTVNGSTSYVVTGLSEDTQYSFRVCSINGNSPPDVRSGQTASATTNISCSGLPNGDWVSVPGDSDYGTSNFCVMKYEAKNESYAATSDASATSVASATPFVNISPTDAAAKCVSIGAQLISNDQWDTIATNIANQASNWSGSSVDSGFLNTGHSDNLPNSGLAASTDSNACSGTGQTCADGSWDSQKRTHTISNGEVIWDIAGNVHEWTSSDGALRGGDWKPGSQAGVFAASQYIALSFSEVNIGFRCVSTAP